MEIKLTVNDRFNDTKMLLLLLADRLQALLFWELVGKNMFNLE